MENLVFEDDGREHRQLGVVDGGGVAASYTGSECMDLGGRDDGAVLRRAGQHPRLGRDGRRARADRSCRPTGAPLADRLLDALDAAQAAGGDRRGQQSAALLVVAERRRLRRPVRLASSTCASTTTRRRSTSCAGIYDQHQLLFGKTPADEWVEVDDDLAAELGERLARLGYDGPLARGVRHLGRHGEPGGARERRRAHRPRRARGAAAAMTDPRGWEAVHVDDLDAIPVAGVVWHPLRRRLGIRAFGTNVYTSEGVGKHIVEDHDELGSGAGGHEEMYVVLRGRARFTIDGEDVDAPAGTIVFIRDPAVKRVAFEQEEGTVVLAVGGEPGRAYEVSPWEHIFAAVAAAQGRPLGRGDRASSRPACASTPATRRSSTTSPAPSRSRAAPSTRSTTCRRRSAATRRYRETAAHRSGLRRRSAASPASRR